MKRVYLSCFILFCLLSHVFSFGGPTDLGALTAAQGLSLQSASMGADFGSVITMCDFNGDGKKDIIIGAPNANSGMGAVVIIFGGKDLSTVDVSDPAASGSGIILTSNGEANFGLKLACLGDADSDPDTEEIFIGESSGILSWVIFGQKSLTTDQDISMLYKCDIYAGSGTTMLDVVAVGDVSKDGLGDLVVSAFDGTNYHGVLLTDFLTPSIDLLTPMINTVTFITNSGQSEPMTFAPAGDFNGDNINDIVIGNLKGSTVTDSAAVFPGVDPYFNAYPSYILNLATLNYGTYPPVLFITGDLMYQVGASVGYAGDVDGDNFDDVIVGAPGVGAVFIVRGGNAFSGPVDLIGIPGNSEDFLIEHGTEIGLELGTTVIGSLSIGSNRVLGVCDKTTSCYIKFGVGANIDLDNMLSQDGFKIYNSGSSAINPMQIALIADVNSDTFPDYVIGQGSVSTVFILYGPNKCTSPCKTCNGLATSDWTKCTSCESGLGVDFVYNLNCHASCPTHTYDDTSSSCATCDTSCKECSGSTANDCDSCYSGGLLPLLYSNTCFGSCPTGTYRDSTSTCDDCNVNCYECSGGDTHCTSCQATEFLYNNVCYGSCPSHSFQNSPTTCASCNNRCEECSTTANNCDSCDSSGLYPLFYNNFCYGTGACPSHAYQDSAATCAICDGNCLNCASSATTCTSCDTSGSLPFLYNSACYSSCPEAAPYSYSYVCLTECPSGTAADSKNICIAITPEVPKAVERFSSTDETRQISNEIMSTISSLILGGVHSIRSQSVAGPVSYYVFLNVDYPENYGEFAKENYGSSRLANPLRYTGRSGSGRVRSVNTYVENQTLLANIGYSIMFLLVCILLIPINDASIALIEKHKKDYKDKWYHKLLKRTSVSLRWSFLINQFVSKYQDLAFFSFLGIYNAGGDDAQDTLNLVVCIFGFLITGAGLFGAFFLIKRLTKKLEAFSEEEKEKEEYTKNDFLGRRVVLYKDLKKDRFMTMLYPFFLMVRVFGFSFVTIFLCNETGIQLGYLNLYAVLMLVYLFKYRPLEENGQLWMTWAYEIDAFIALLGVTLLAIYNKADGTNENTRTAFGYLIIVANMGMLVLNFISFGLEIFEYVALAYENLKTVHQKLKNKNKIKPEPIQSHDASFMSPTASFMKVKELELQPPITGTPSGMPEGRRFFNDDESPEKTCIEGGLADDKTSLIKLESSGDLRKTSPSQKRPTSSSFKFPIEEIPETET